jgi:hypothetical protein
MYANMILKFREILSFEVLRAGFSVLWETGGSLMLDIWQTLAPGHYITYTRAHGVLFNRGCIRSMYMEYITNLEKVEQ